MYFENSFRSSGFCLDSCFCSLSYFNVFSVNPLNMNLDTNSKSDHLTKTFSSCSNFDWQKAGRSVCNRYVKFRPTQLSQDTTKVIFAIKPTTITVYSHTHILVNHTL